MIRAVCDTNGLVSALIKPIGTPREVLRALRNGEFTIVFSDELWTEVAAVLKDPKIRGKYEITRRDLETISDLFALRGEWTVIDENIRISRDPGDDFILETAVSGKAGFIVSGDADLLALKRFRKIRIVDPKTFLAVLRSRPG